MWKMLYTRYQTCLTSVPGGSLFFPQKLEMVCSFLVKEVHSFCRMKSANGLLELTKYV